MLDCSKVPTTIRAKIIGLRDLRVPVMAQATTFRDVWSNIRDQFTQDEKSAVFAKFELAEKTKVVDAYESDGADVAVAVVRHLLGGLPFLCFKSY